MSIQEVVRIRYGGGTLGVWVLQQSFWWIGFRRVYHLGWEG